MPIMTMVTKVINVDDNDWDDDDEDYVILFQRVERNILPPSTQSYPKGTVY